MLYNKMGSGGIWRAIWDEINFGQLDEHFQGGMKVLWCDHDLRLAGWVVDDRDLV